MIVIACNTASSVAYESVKKQCPEIEIVNVIDPVIQRISKNKEHKTIGIIELKALLTLKFIPKIKNASVKAEVKSLATPLLAAMIEEGFYNDEISEVIVHNYLKQDSLKSINQLIFGLYALSNNSKSY